MGQDHRVRITKMLLQESLIKLLRDKPIAKITVREVCEQAGINRATFYAHYHDLDDLNKEIERGLAKAVTDAIFSMPGTASIERFCGEICRIIVENRGWCEVVFGENGDPELPVRIIENLRVDCIATWSRDYPNVPQSHLESLYTFAANGSLAVVSQWVQSGMKQSPEDVAAFIGAMIASCLKGL